MNSFYNPFANEAVALLIGSKVVAEIMELNSRIRIGRAQWSKAGRADEYAMLKWSLGGLLLGVDPIAHRAALH